MHHKSVRIVSPFALWPKALSHLMKSPLAFSLTKPALSVDEVPLALLPPRKVDPSKSYSSESYPLLFLNNNQSRNHARYPAAQGKDKNQQKRAAAFIDNGKRWKNNAKDHAPD